MTFLPKEKLFTKRWFVDYGLITVGSFIMAVGFVFFITPHKIVPGGIYGLGIIVYYMTKGMALWPEGFPIGIRVYRVNTIAIISLPPEVALALKINPSPIPVRTPPKMQESKTSFTNGASPISRIQVMPSINIDDETNP